METLAFVSQKGGAGKTTLALHTAVEAASRGLRTLLIDLDPQASAILWADRRGSEKNIDIDVVSEHAMRLPAALQQAERQGYDLVVIDTAPNADAVAASAAKLANLTLIPCRPAILDLDAIKATLDICQMIQRPAEVVLNAARAQSKRVADEARAAVQKRGGTVADIVIHERADFQHALIDGRVAQEYRPDGQAAAEIAALFDLMARKRGGLQTRNHRVTKPRKQEREIA